MIAKDSNALTCDLAETYGIFDYRALPVELLGVLSCGLGENSRIKKKLSGAEVDTNTLLLSIIADGVNTIAWMLSDSGQKGENRPKSIYRSIMGEVDEEETVLFDSPEAFEEMRARLLEMVGG